MDDLRFVFLESTTFYFKLVETYFECVKRCGALILKFVYHFLDWIYLDAYKRDFPVYPEH